MEWLIVLLAMIVALLTAMVIRLDYAMRQLDDRLEHTHHVAHEAHGLLIAHLLGVDIHAIPLRRDEKE